jgi:hypothetical protein
MLHIIALILISENCEFRSVCGQYIESLLQETDGKETNMDTSIKIMLKHILPTRPLHVRWKISSKGLRPPRPLL